MDFYRRGLARAAWNWMEGRDWWKRGLSREKKDIRDGRAAKRGARQNERSEITSEVFEWEQARDEPEPWE